MQLGGKGQPGAFLRIYLDNTPLQEVLVPDSGQWLTTLKDTAPGVYTLRVDQLDDSGQVTSRFETPFKRETLEALALAEAGPAAPGLEEPRVNDATPEETASPEPAPKRLLRKRPRSCRTVPMRPPARRKTRRLRRQPKPKPLQNLRLPRQSRLRLPTQHRLRKLPFSGTSVSETAAEPQPASEGAPQPEPEPVQEPVAAPEPTPEPAPAPAPETVAQAPRQSL